MIPWYWLPIAIGLAVMLTGLIASWIMDLIINHRTRVSEELEEDLW